jgi:NAD(P)-dependent dehydrogenase (short-subunit alcohol dehydrogenase family)
MKVAITGTSGLAKTIIDTLEATPYRGETIEVFTPRIEDITMNGDLWWGWENVDVLINFAHDDFEQTKILEIAHNAWVDDDSKFIINFSSRAAQPNISKGYLYAAAKASLNHLANNYQYNSEKRYKMTTLCLGLLNSPMPSVSKNDVAGLVYSLVTSYPELEVAEMTVQAHHNYRESQQLKEFQRGTTH